LIGLGAVDWAAGLVGGICEPGCKLAACRHCCLWFAVAGSCCAGDDVHCYCGGATAIMLAVVFAAAAACWGSGGHDGWSGVAAAISVVVVAAEEAACCRGGRPV
jgi:hypothetical protein